MIGEVTELKRVKTGVPSVFKTATSEEHEDGSITDNPLRAYQEGAPTQGGALRRAV